MKRANKIYGLAVNFLKCGITGLCLELLFTSLGTVFVNGLKMTGTTSLVMFPIYGMGVLLEPIGELFDRWWEQIVKRKPSFLMRMIGHGVLYMLLIFLAEYSSGLLLKTRGICPWDYSGIFMNIHGVIRLDFAPLWFGTGLLFEQITKRKGSFGESAMEIEPLVLEPEETKTKGRNACSPG